MSILLVEVVSQGVIFGADRNITWTNRDGSKYLGHTQRAKVLRWPQKRALIGYVGHAQIGGVPTDEWLYDFIGRNITFRDFEALAEQLRSDVEQQRRIDEGNSDPAGLVIHLGGFEVRGGSPLPTIWLITNAHDFVDGVYCDIRREFKKSDEFWNPNYDPAKLRPSEVRGYLGQRASRYDPFWFHQGWDLGTFNTLENFLKAAFMALCQPGSQLGHSLPSNLLDWEAQVKMSVLTYGAYFQAYKEQSKQAVGGGADVVSVPWPEQ